MQFRFIILLFIILFNQNASHANCKAKVTQAINDVVTEQAERFKSFLQRKKARYSKQKFNDIEKFSDPKELEKQYKMQQSDVIIHFNGVEDARFFAQNHTIFKKYGFKPPTHSPMNNWVPYVSTLEKSKAKGRIVGYENKLENGNWARYRIDWSPEDGAHFNVEMKVKGRFGQSKNIKFATFFKCNNEPCTEAQVLKMIDKINQNPDRLENIYPIKTRARDLKPTG